MLDARRDGGRREKRRRVITLTPARRGFELEEIDDFHTVRDLQTTSAKLSGNGTRRRCQRFVAYVAVELPSPGRRGVCWRVCHDIHHDRRRTAHRIHRWERQWLIIRVDITSNIWVTAIERSVLGDGRTHDINQQRHHLLRAERRHPNLCEFGTCVGKTSKHSVSVSCHGPIITLTLTLVSARSEEHTQSSDHGSVAPPSRKRFSH